MCLSKRCGAGGGRSVVVGAGVGEDGVDDAGGGIGDGEHDDGLLDLGPVDALDVERDGDEFLQGRGAWASSSTDDLGKDRWS